MKFFLLNLEIEVLTEIKFFYRGFESLFQLLTTFLHNNIEYNLLKCRVTFSKNVFLFFSEQFSDLPQPSKSKQKQNMGDRLSPTRVSLPPANKNERRLDHEFGRPT